MQSATRWVRWCTFSKYSRKMGRERISMVSRCGKARRGSGEKRGVILKTSERRASGFQLFLHQLIHQRWIRLPLRCLHHLADEKALDRRFARAVLLHLLGIRRN